MTNTLDELLARLGALAEDERQEIADVACDATAAMRFVPNPGPQTEAYLSAADLLLYGGAAGGGKSALLIGLSSQEHERSVVFRRESTEMDGLIAYSKEVLGGAGSFNGSSNEWTLPNGRSLKFGGMKEPDDWRKYAGRARDFMGFDGAGEFLEEQVASIIAWNRSALPGRRCRVVFASNPPRGGAGKWMIEWFAPWLDPLFPNSAKPGELRFAVMVKGKTLWVDGPETVAIDGESYIPLSRTFIPAKLADNPYNDTPEYRARLQSLPPTLRAQLLHGDFLAGREDHPDQVIPSAWIEAAQRRWNAGRPAGAAMTTIGLDVGGGGPDPSVLAPLYGAWFDELTVIEGETNRDPRAIAARVVAAMRHGARVHIDLTGGWGSGVRSHLLDSRIACIGVVFSAASGARSKDQKFGFANMRAEIWWRFREALDPLSGEDIALPPDRLLAAELAAPTWDLRKDNIIVEAKDDVKKRLGSSTDRADAVLLAWHKRKEAAAMQSHGRQGQWQSAAPLDDPFGFA